MRSSPRLALSTKHRSSPATASSSSRKSCLWPDSANAHRLRRLRLAFAGPGPQTAHARTLKIIARTAHRSWMTLRELPSRDDFRDVFAEILAKRMGDRQPGTCLLRLL